MPKYIKKKALKNAIECCTWYHINKNGELVEGANSDEHEPLYKYSDIKRIIKGLPTRKFEDEPQSLEQFRVGLEYHTDTTHFGKTKGESITTNKVEDEPQTERSK